MSDIDKKFLLEKTADIYGALRRIVLLKHAIRIKIEGSDEHYSTALTHASMKNQSFFFDRIIPSGGNDLIRKGKAFIIVSDAQGIKIEFKVTGRRAYQKDKEQYRVEFPEKVLYLQRRTAYRVDVPPAHRILLRLDLDEDGKQPLIGRVVDLSSSGFKAIFGEQANEQIGQEQRIDIAQMKFNEQNNLDCSLDAKYIYFNQEKKQTYIGFSFAMISPMGQRYLDKLITQFQWEARRIAKMEEEQQQEEFTLGFEEGSEGEEEEKEST